MEFKELLIEKIEHGLTHNYKDNYDYVRFGPEPDLPLLKLIRNQIKDILYHVPGFRKREINLLQPKIDLHCKYFNNLYASLEDEDSRKLLLDVAAYRLLGHKKYKLPLNTPLYWEMLNKIENLKDPQQSIDPHFLNFILYRYDLKELGYPVQFFFTALGILIDFYIGQYELKRNGTIITAMPGDVVIDGGACWGDTALFFGSKIKNKGKIYSFEFIPANIGIFRKNLSLNQACLEKVELVPHPLWSRSNENVFYTDMGPGSKVSFEKPDHFDGLAQTVTIDDFVSRKQEDRIDFIKLDIEGAELQALKGAEQTLKAFKPRLAVALYHRLSDFKDIPMFLQSLNLGYKFYFSHCTIQAEESLLFAVAS